MSSSVQKAARRLAVGLLCALPAFAIASPLGDALEKADALRTSDPAEFEKAMATARALIPSATAAERDKLALLGAYQDWRAGRVDRATSTARALAAKSTDVVLRYRATVLVANLSALTRNYAMGADYLARAGTMEAAVMDPAVLAMGASAAATLYNQFEQYELAEHYARRTLTYADTPRTRCIAYENLARALVHQHRIDNERGELVAPLDTCRQAREPIALHLLQTSHARFLIDAGRHAEAARLLRANLEGAKQSGYTRLTAEFHSLIAEALLGTGDLDGARHAALDALRITGAEPTWMPMLDARRVLYEVEKRRGNVAAALGHLEALANGERTELTDLQARERAYQDGRIRLLREQQRSDTLRQQNRVLQLERRVAEQRRTLLFTVVGALVLIVSLLAFWSARLLRVQRRLRYLSERDPLTGISNRRHFVAGVQSALEASRARQQPVSLLLLDLDHFKSINDHAGHETGDRVLLEIARVGRQHAGPSELFGRLGGEEYGMCLPGTSLEEARAVANRWLAAIREAVAYTHPDGRPVTASIGVSSTERSGYDYDRLMRDADAAMYSAKACGRNRVDVTTD